MPPIPKTFKQRIDDMVDKTSVEHPTLGNCWSWLGVVRKKDGRGVITKNNKRTLAYRHVWKVYNGDIPTGLKVLHKCDNPNCVNPEHLFVGTQQDNLKDMRDKGHQVRGERQASAVLTETDVIYIRKKYQRKSKEYGFDGLAKVFKVSSSAIMRVVHKRTWKHVNEEQVGDG